MNSKVTGSVSAYPSLKSESPRDLMFHQGHGILDVSKWPQQQCIVGATRNLLGYMGGSWSAALMSSWSECQADALSLQSDWLPALPPAISVQLSQSGPISGRGTLVTQGLANSFIGD